MTDISGQLRSHLADRYRLDRALGSGGMATVYLAHDLRHDRAVAIKVLHEDLGATLGGERFLAEIKTTARLQHPHILPLLDSGSAGGLLFYVMPFVEGETLRDRLARETQLPIDDVVRLVREIADALGFAHAQGVVHRDIKPENILLQGGHAVVADFGIALAVSAAGGARLTQTGLSLGTPQYMAPEQAMGERSVGAAADIFALGAVAYEMLTGNPPFEGATAQAIVARTLHDRPTPPSIIRDTVPRYLEAAVLKALARLPADRWATAAEFARALEDRTDPQDSASAGRPARRRALQALVLLVALVTTAGASWLLAGRSDPAPSLGRRSSVTSVPGMEFEPTLSPDGRFVAYTVGPVGQARIFVQQVSGGRPSRVTADDVDEERFPRWSPDGSMLAFRRGGRLWAVPALGGSPRLLLANEDSATGSMDWSSTGDRIAFIRPGRALMVTAVSGGTAAAVLSHPALSAPAWSPDDRWIAVMAGNEGYNSAVRGIVNLAPSTIWLVRPDGSGAHPITDSLSLNAMPVWGADGRSLYYVSTQDGPRDVYRLVLDREGRPRTPPQRITTGADPHSLSLSRDGRVLAYSEYRPRSAVHRVPIPRSGEASPDGAERLTFGNELVEAMSVTRDGRWLYYDAERDGNADLFRIEIGRQIAERLTDHPADDYSPELSPDGREIAFTSRRNGTRDLFLMDSGGGEPRPLLVDSAASTYASWSPDGRRIAFRRSGEIALIERQPSGGWSAPDLLQGLVGGSISGVPRWHPDGTELIVTANSSIVRVHLRERRVDTVYTAVPGARESPIPIRGVPSPDGRAVYFKSYLDGDASFWSVPLLGGPPRRLLRLDPAHPSHRVDWTTDGRHLYFAIHDAQSDIWVVNLRPD